MPLLFLTDLFLYRPMCTESNFAFKFMRELPLLVLRVFSPHCTLYSEYISIFFFHFHFSSIFSFPFIRTANTINGSSFSISRVDRLNMGAYLCIASNGIPPTVSKRVMLIVHCKYTKNFFWKFSIFLFFQMTRN